jgi:hypothetical protein
MTKEDADYRIDKALSTGRMDKKGALVFSAKDFPANSSRDQLIDRLTEEIAALGLALPRRIAEAKVDAALAAKADRRSDRIARIGTRFGNGLGNTLACPCRKSNPNIVMV